MNPALGRDPGLLQDERSDPPLRAVIGSLLSRCTHASIALSNVRLAMIDLADDELAAVRQCRILLGRLDARSLGGLSVHDAAALRHADALLHFIGSSRVEIRSAGLATWAPDFSIYTRHRGAGHSQERTGTALIGAHWFREPTAAGGPSFTVRSSEALIVELALARFDELWQNAYDIRAAVLDTVRMWSGRV
jgi:hypothetical protein